MIVHEVEQNTPEWLELRAGKPTASEFKKIVTSKGEPSATLSKYARTLAAEMFTGGQVDGFEGNYHTERGHELEAQAISSYEFINDVSVERIGFVTDDKQEVGCSPDGFVGDDGLVEIKCLKAETHIETIQYYKKHGKAPPLYYQQTQGQMWVAERKWCDLIFYYPTLPMLIVRAEPSKEFVEKLKVEIKNILSVRDDITKQLKELSNG